MAGVSRVHRLLLRLYPARFREEYGAPLERQFLDEYREARSRGARLSFWLRAISDLAITVPAETLRESRQDLRHALRVHRRSPAAAVLAFVALALAIGATTGVFSVLNALLVRSLPFRDAGRLVELSDSPAGRPAARLAFNDWRLRASYLDDATLYAISEMSLSVTRESVHVLVAQTSSNFFVMLGVKPVLGRAFAPDEEEEGRAPVAVISHSLWRQFFGGDPRVLGSTVRLNGAPVTLIGVAAPGFDYPGFLYPQRTAVWTPTVFDRKILPAMYALQREPIGRLKPGLSLAQANAVFTAEMRRINPRSRDLTPRLTPLRDLLAGPVQKSSLVLLGIVVFVLLIACANLALLLLSRVSERRQELAVRAALGASRARLVQQLTTESAALTLVAAVAGLAVAHWAARLATVFQPAQLGTQEYTILDWRVLGFAVGLAVLTGVLFGVLPGWLIGRFQPSHDLTETRSSARGAAAGRMRAALVVTQATVAVVLVAGAISMGHAFLKLVGTDLGFQTDSIATLSVSLSGTRYEAGRAEADYYREALDRLRSLPDVESAGAVRNLPLTQNASISASFGLEPGRGIGAWAIAASPGYFRSIAMEILQGRDFTPADRRDTTPVVIVNAALARRLGVTSGLIGRKLFSPWGAKQYTIVGLVGTTRMAGPSFPGGPDLYYPVEQQPPPFLTFVARVRGNAERSLAACRAAVQGVDPLVPVYDVKTLDQRLSDNLARPRFYTTAILFLSGLALLLAATGVYGIATQSIAQRTDEIGVRLAVGASPLRLRRSLLWQSLLPLIAGMAAGVAGSVGLGKSLTHLMRSAEPIGLWTCAAAALLLTLTAALSIWSATRRILRIDPVTVLRAE